MNDLNNYNSAVKVLALRKFAGVSPRLFAALMNKFNSLDELLAAKPDSLQSLDGIDEQTSDIIHGLSNNLQLADDYYIELTQRDIDVVTCLDSNFPYLLEELNNPPPMLYVRGLVPENTQKIVTVAGTSKASQEGIELTVKLSQLLAESNVQVVSSLRGGIDGAAHLGCKSADGKSFAVLDSGFDTLDLSEQMPLAIDIAQNGGVISEYSPEEISRPDNLSNTNRLLSGLSHAVVFTELYSDSNQTLDLLSFCHDIGKLAFLMVDPQYGALSDETTLATASRQGLITIVGFDKIDNIIKALV